MNQHRALTCVITPSPEAKRYRDRIPQIPKRSRARYKTKKGDSRYAGKAEKRQALTTGMSWAGTGTKVKSNTLTGKGTFDPRVPLDQPGEEGDDTLIWADVPKILKERLEAKTRQITEDCLMCNVKGILSLYEHDIIQHVIQQQLRGEHMPSLLRRQGTYQSSGTAGEVRTTVGKLSKSSFLGQDPSGENPIPASLWDNEELSEKGTLMKDVQDTVWNYLRVHLTRILHKSVLSRVQAQEDMYRNFPDMRDGVHNERMPWGQ